MTEITQIDLGMVNAYLIKTNDEFILVDTGIPQLLTRLEKALSQAGCTQGKLKMIILTHGDWDHAGNALTLKQEYGAELAMHQADFPMVREGQPMKREAKGVIWKLMSKMNERPGKPNPDFEIDVFLNDGQRLDEYGVAAQVLHIPGHTPGSIAILSDDGQLISGDILGNQRKPDLSPLVENREEILASLEKIKQANPEIIFPGHGKSFTGEALENIN